MSTKDTSSSYFSLGKGGFLPQEEMLEVGKKSKELTIGIPKEINTFENRVPITPEAVELLVNNGHKVCIESKAGIPANYTDNEYSECGATIFSNKKEIYSCDIILKVAPLAMSEIEHLKGNQVIISLLHITSQSGDYIKELMKRKVTAIAYEKIKDRYNCFPIIRSMSEIAGIASILIASEYLSNVHKGKGVLLGGITGITPAEVIILGAGTAGEYAARSALGLGASIKIFDDSLQKLRQIQTNLGQRLYTSIFHPQVIEKSLKSADVVVGAMHLLEKGDRIYITEEMVKKMKKGSVIVDISIAQGGCIETSRCKNHGSPVYTLHGVTHYCVSNIPSRVSRTASIALSNVITPLLLSMGEAGGAKNILISDLGVRNGIYIYNGILTSSYIGNLFGIPAKDIDLLMAAF